MHAIVGEDDEVVTPRSTPRNLVVCVGPSYSSSSQDVVLELLNYGTVDVAAVEVGAADDSGERDAGGGSDRSAMEDYFRAQCADIRAKRTALIHGAAGLVATSSTVSRPTPEGDDHQHCVQDVSAEDEARVLYRGGVFTLRANDTPEDILDLAERIQRDRCCHCEEEEEEDCLTRISRRQVTAVVNLGDNTPRVTDALARLLRVPGNDPSTSGVRVSKKLATDALARAGLRTPEQRLCASVDEAVDFFRSTSSSADSFHRVVLKSDRGTAKLGTHVIEEEGEVAPAFHRISRLGAFDCQAPGKSSEEGQHGVAQSGVLCQEYLDGSEYAFDGCVHDGTVVVCQVLRYEFDEGGGHKKKKSAKRLLEDRSVLCDPNEEVVADIIQYGCKALCALGMRYGAFHMELKVCPTRGPAMIELNPRVDGARLGWMMKQGRSDIVGTGTGGISTEYASLLNGGCVDVCQNALLAALAVDPAATLQTLTPPYLARSYRRRSHFWLVRLRAGPMCLGKLIRPVGESLQRHLTTISGFNVFKSPGDVVGPDVDDDDHHHNRLRHRSACDTDENVCISDTMSDDGSTVSGPRDWMGFVGLASTDLGKIIAEYWGWRGREAAGLAYYTDRTDGATRGLGSTEGRRQRRRLRHEFLTSQANTASHVSGQK